MNEPQVRWYEPPVVWVGVAVLVASLAACIALIIVAASGSGAPV